MKARWQAATAKFAALKPREKQLVAATTIIAIVMGGYSLWVEPAQLRATGLQKQIVQQKTEMQGLQAQVAGLKSQLKDPDAPNKAALSEAKTQLAAVERTLHEYDKVLVSPERVPLLLQSLLTRHRGLELLSLQTLAPQPLLGPPPAAEGKPEAKTADAKKTPPAPVAKGANIHKHGIEIKMAGSYLDLLGYVADLEQLPQKLLWGRMALTVTGYPRCELTLTVYTLSLESTWMTV